MRLRNTLPAALAALIAAGPAVAHDEAATARVISVNGAGEVLARPDRARLSMTVDKLDPDLKKAEAEVNRIVRAYLAEAKALGAREEHITTTGVGINPEYVWPQPGRERRFTGYRVTRQIQVRVDDLERLGDFILRATQAGVNQVQPPLLESSRARELEKQALAQAAAEARDKARALAETLGVKLGLAHRVVESHAGQPVPLAFKAMRAESADGNAEMGLATGEIRYHASVHVEFELLAP